jgi:hypothetical protein
MVWSSPTFLRVGWTNAQFLSSGYYRSTRALLFDKLFQSIQKVYYLAAWPSDGVPTLHSLRPEKSITGRKTERQGSITRLFFTIQGYPPFSQIPEGGYHRNQSPSITYPMVILVSCSVESVCRWAETKQGRVASDPDEHPRALDGEDGSGVDEHRGAIGCEERPCVEHPGEIEPSPCLVAEDPHVLVKETENRSCARVPGQRGVRTKPPRFTPISNELKVLSWILLSNPDIGHGYRDFEALKFRR